MVAYEEEWMMSFFDTITEISKILSSHNIEFILTRFSPKSEIEPDDLDLLVRHRDFQEVVRLATGNGYELTSHEQALGGRIKGMQINLVKPSMVKIDLHQDFTWRGSRYFDLKMIWGNTQKVKIDKTEIFLPKDDIDAFMVIVNIIFEKTYITKRDFEHITPLIKEIFEKDMFRKQADKYNWSQTYSKFKNWFERLKTPSGFPIFLPIDLILYSYFEKLIHEHQLHITSLLYYFFFRSRFFINKKLPYE